MHERVEPSHGRVKELWHRLGRDSVEEGRPPPDPSASPSLPPSLPLLTAAAATAPQPLLCHRLDGSA